jgi:hypothetical protein
MTLAKRTTVVGVFEDRTHAQQAVDELRREGFREDEIGVVARDGLPETTTGEVPSQWEEGATAGAVAGAGLGGLWALGIAAGLLPAVGPVIAGGLLASILASAAGAAAVGGLLGALIGMGVPEDEAEYYHGEFEAGRTLVTVKVDGRYDQAVGILRRHGAYDIENRPARPVDVAVNPAVGPAGAIAPSTEAGVAPPLGSAPTAGGTEHRTRDVSVSREETKEQFPVSGRGSL